MKVKRILSIFLAFSLLLAMAPVSFAADNSTQANAIPVTPGEEVSFTAEPDTAYWYSVETTAPGQIILVESNYSGISIYAPAGSSLNANYTSGNPYIYYTRSQEPGIYGIRFYHYDTSRDYTFTVTLLDNDANEYNNTAATAAKLTSGVPVEFQLGYADYDYFSIDVAAGQDVQLDLSGFNYATLGRFHLNVPGLDSLNIYSNRTYYYHAATAGAFTFSLYGYYDDVNDTSLTTETFTVTATVLEGDANEPNDTLADATRLHIGTDTNFSMGGAGDEDWFTFESAFDAGESAKLYTLNLLDLNSDYSDVFYYDLYAPDGSTVMSGNKVTFRHINVIACEQEGLYALRLYRTSLASPRTELRIRVDEGGADPYEPNDTWLTAAQIQAGQPVQFILSNTNDSDWFKFEVPQANMTMHLPGMTNLGFGLYSAEDLEEFGTSECLDDRYSAASNYYYQFAEPGIYYLRLFCDQSYISEDLHTLQLTLTEAGDNETNNSWKTAAPLYEGVAQSYDLSAWNDADWFQFEVPEGATLLRVAGDWSNSDQCRYLYKASDFEIAGDDAAWIDYWRYGSYYTLVAPAAGTYYLACKYHNPDMDERNLDQTVVFYLSDNTPAQTIAAAEPLAEGQWQTDIYGGYYALGALKAGDELRLYGENVDYMYLYSADGTLIANADGTSRGQGISIPTDGDYYLKVSPYTKYKTDGDWMPYSVLYDVADRDLAANESLTIDCPDIITVAVGEIAEVNLRLSPYDAKSGKLGYLLFCNSPASSAIASYASNGTVGYYVTGKAVGTTTMKVYLNGYSDTVYKTITINVVDSTAAQKITISNAPAELPLGTSVTLQAALTPADATDSITWTSSDSSVLHVNSSGKVTAVGDGSAIITATATSGVTASVTIKVTDAPAAPEVTGITLDDYDLTLYMGEAGGQLNATVSPAGSNVTVVWTSSNLSAATVDQTGTITPVAPGVSVITAAAGDYRASCVVTVQAERVRVESIFFDTGVLEIPLGGESTLRPNFNPVDATVQSMTWASSDPNVATVSRTGIVNALAVGETTITATTLDGGHTASILIRVTAAAQLGDINGDGYIDAADAMMTLQVAVGKITLTEEQTNAADVNKDGWVDAADAVRILRYNAGLIDSL